MLHKFQSILFKSSKIFCITVEFYAILCLLASFLMLNGLK